MDGRIVPPVAQVSTPFFPVEDQTGLEILREYLKAISTNFIHDVTELRQELADFTNECLLNDAPNHSGKLSYFCRNLADGSRSDKTYLYVADYRVGGLICDRVIRPWYIESRLTRRPNENAMSLRLSPRHKPLWIVFFRVQEEHELVGQIPDSVAHRSVEGSGISR